MNSPTPTGAAPSTIWPGQNGINDAAQGGGLRPDVQVSFRARRTQRPKPPRLSNDSSGQSQPQPQPQQHRAIPSLPQLQPAGSSSAHSAYQQVPPYQQVSLNNAPPQPRQHFYAAYTQTPPGVARQGLMQTSPYRPHRPYFHSPYSGISNANGILYDFTLNAPVLRQVPTRHHQGGNRTHSPPSDIPRYHSQPSACGWTGHNGFSSPTVIDLTQDDPPVIDAIPMTVVSGRRGNTLSSQLSRPLPPNSVSADDSLIEKVTRTPAAINVAPSATYLNSQSAPFTAGADERIENGSLRTSEVSSNLPCISAICEQLQNSGPDSQRSKVDTTRAELSAKGVPIMPHQKEGNRFGRCNAHGSLGDKAVMEEIEVDTHGNLVEGSATRPGDRLSNTKKLHSHTDTGTTTGAKTTLNLYHTSQDVNSLDFAIYSQSGAAEPPHGIKLPRQVKQNTGVQGQRRFVHANPHIHLLHNRSETWHTRKAAEIQNRPRRKFWFGKVSQRLRWIRNNQRCTQDETPTNLLPRRLEPQPRMHSRPMDFGDVPEDKLPVYVQENPEWLRACEFFRQTREMREVKARASRRCEQEMRSFFNTVMQSPFD